LRRELAARPKRGDGVLLGIVALLAIAQDEGDPVGKKEISSGVGDDLHDRRNRTGMRQSANDCDECGSLMPAVSTCVRFGYASRQIFGNSHLILMRRCSGEFASIFHSE